MSKHTGKAYSFLMYLLAIIAFFFLGLLYAGMIDAGKGQMLAGGAIVFGYGVVGAFIGLILSIVVAFKSNRTIIIRVNILLLIIIIASITYFRIKYQKRQDEKLKNDAKTEQPTTKPITSPANNEISAPMAMRFNSDSKIKAEPIMGLGMFKPNLYANKPLFFYGGLTYGKSVQEHTPIDSITFKQREYGGFDIATAPPWLVPEHLKLDYDMLYFKVKSISHDFIEVVVNTTTNQTAHVDRYAGEIQYWPEFLLHVNSVEFVENSIQNVHERDFLKSGIVTTSFRFMKPKIIKQNWMQVDLLNDTFEKVGQGWIQWKSEEKLLIRYALLS